MSESQAWKTIAEYGGYLLPTEGRLPHGIFWRAQALALSSASVASTNRDLKPSWTGETKAAIPSCRATYGAVVQASVLIPPFKDPPPAFLRVAAMAETDTAKSKLPATTKVPASKLN